LFLFRKNKKAQNKKLFGEVQNDNGKNAYPGCGYEKKLHIL